MNVARMKKKGAAAVMAASLTALGALAPAPAARAAVLPGPAPLVVIELENTSLSQLNSMNAPFLMGSGAGSMHTLGTVFTTYTAPDGTLNSLPNYIDMTAGQYDWSGTGGSDCNTDTACSPYNGTTGGITSDGTTPVDNIFNQVANAGYTWGGWAEEGANTTKCKATDGPAAIPPGPYVAHHNPAIYYADQHTTCASGSAGQGYQPCPITDGSECNDSADITLHDYNWIIPSNEDNMHNSQQLLTLTNDDPAGSFSINVTTGTYKPGGGMSVSCTSGSPCVLGPYGHGTTAATIQSDFVNIGGNANGVVSGSTGGPYTLKYAENGYRSGAKVTVSTTGTTTATLDETEITASDTWLNSEVTALEAMTPQPVVVITTDQGGTGTQVVYTAEVGPGVRAGVTDITPYTHFGTLRAMEDYYGISTHLGNAASATPLPLPSGVTFKAVDSGQNDTPTSPQATGSVAFQNNTLYLLTFDYAGATANTLGVSGGGLTWTKSVGSHNSEIWCGSTTSGASTGSLSVTWSGTSTATDWTVTEVGHANVSSPIVQAHENNGTATSGSVTMSAFADSDDAAFGFFNHTANETSTVDSSGEWAAIKNFSASTTPAKGDLTETKIGQDLAISASWASNVTWRGMGLEIAPA